MRAILLALSLAAPALAQSGVEQQAQPGAGPMRAERPQPLVKRGEPVRDPDRIKSMRVAADVA